MANSVDPDQTAPLGLGALRVNNIAVESCKLKVLRIKDFILNYQQFKL